ncbi:UDP-N-acetylmuramoyl-L-alanyl-D-glutamate--2,6-diaminopimelate ligase [Flavobacterium agricola]|uniref:UDP-N-acetylmuramoyl-L-alanyl-D-glutamate--2,6-diaminopimelate ligase n=1 Tax=Flavobacterium agricola TaxID=2870839 RepID=A0ABY6LWL1_9FLAO|nr:UDP-N-acetylmuramoyl-L-alanyl-D-glutamate--2,6-diaminopimelate ligase [Flavobacterium agricola]UYW00656.1 UDP-N-acetylmuramoyl-L-alanyl-D-glutamate--2,6-diaminopimelate ligase [Flavobacterium agricola]
MKVLKDILYKVAIQAVHGSTHIEINKIVFDSRNVNAHDVFVAIKGTLTDGHLYIDKAIALGAKAIICEQLPEQLQQQITYVVVQNASEALAYMSANYYNEPSSKLKLVGVTGTNGKTTVATLLYQLFTNAGYKVGLISTVKILVHTTEYKTNHTTPDSVLINYYLNEMVTQGCEFCFMEVSSIGIDQHRTTALDFAGGIFTNLSHDHLDYHHSFAAYRDAKKAFFDQLSKNAFAITNADDKNGALMLQNTAAKKFNYAIKTYANYQAKILENHFSGLLLRIDNHEVWSKLVGNFNAYNLLAIYATAINLGLPQAEVLRLISELNSVTGRFQYVVSPNQITAIVDYAHTPDALENVLKTIKEIRTKNENIITVVGCGGDRDKTKRPEMAKIAAQYSNKVIFTSDNPRTENPQTILDEMEKGVPAEYFNKTLSILDRKQAIKAACQMANAKDIILIAGKGHETYQEINGVRHDFDDFKIVTEFLFVNQ